MCFLWTLFKYEYVLSNYMYMHVHAYNLNKLYWFSRITTMCIPRAMPSYNVHICHEVQGLSLLCVNLWTLKSLIFICLISHVCSKWPHSGTWAAFLDVWISYRTKCIRSYIVVIFSQWCRNRQPCSTFPWLIVFSLLKISTSCPAPHIICINLLDIG